MTPFPQRTATLRTRTSRNGFGGTALIVDPTLSFWPTDFGDLTNVIWGTSVNDPSRVAEIRIEGLGGDVVRLNSFQAADWDGSANNQTFRVYDGQYNLLYEVAGVDVDDISHDTFFPAVSATTLNLQWDHGWAVALDNISLNVSSVPEPSSLLLAIPVGIGLLLRRNRQRNIGPTVSLAKPLTAFRNKSTGKCTHWMSFETRLGTANQTANDESPKIIGEIHDQRMAWTSFALLDQAK